MPHSELQRLYQGRPLRVLIVPGLHDSGPAHWQTWLQCQYHGALRVRQRDWHTPDLDAWAGRIAQTLERASPDTTWIAVAHSFGTLALARYLVENRHRIASALLVAPADPDKFGVAAQLPQGGLGLPSILVGSETDPWMRLEQARAWAVRWGSRFINLGAAGHVNTGAGYGPWVQARYLVDQMIRDQQHQRRLDRAHPMELSYAI